MWVLILVESHYLLTIRNIPDMWGKYDTCVSPGTSIWELVTPAYSFINVGISRVNE